MLLILRKVFFYFFLILYFIVTPYAILYALGYIFNPTEKALVQTGLISIETEPRGARIFIHGKKFTSKTPTVIRDLLPGRYHVRVTKKGYSSWERMIDILPEKAVELNPVILLSERPKEEVLSPVPYERLIPQLIQSHVLLWEDKSFGSLHQIDLFFRHDTPLADSLNQLSEFLIEKVIQKRGSDRALIQLKRDGKKNWAILEISPLRREIQPLGDIIPSDVTSLFWDEASTKYIYFIHRAQLYRIELPNINLTALPETDIIGAGAKHNRVYLLKKDYSLIELNNKGENPQSLSENLSLGKEIFSRETGDSYQIEIFKREFFQKDLLLFLSNRGALISNRLPYYLVDSGVRGIDYSNRLDENKLLFWTNTEIGVISFSKETNGIFEKGPTKIILYSQGKNIRQASWAVDDTHVIFLDENQVYLLEAESPVPYLVRKIAPIKEDSDMIYHERDQAIYYLDAESYQLMKRKLFD